jgi:FdhD protein
MKSGSQIPGDEFASKSPSLNSEQAGAGVISTDVVCYRATGKPKRRPDFLAAEEPLEIRVRGRSIAVTMRTPGNDSELAAGFLLSEGIVRNQSDIVDIAPCLQGGAPQNTLNVFLAPSVEVDLERLSRNVFASSSCGLCGKASIETVHQHFPPVSSPLRISVRNLSKLPAIMRAAQASFNRTGGLHAAAVFDAKGKMIVLREDVGRHNAVDKALGHGFLEGDLPYKSHVLLVSGRASFEIVQKALAAGIPIICAISAPSSLAVDFARENRQTLVGFLRGRTMNVYAGAERIVSK